MKKYYKGKFSKYCNPDYNLYEVSYLNVTRRSYDIESGIIRHTTTLLSTDQIEKFLEQNECVEIDNGPELCLEFDKLVEEFEDTRDWYGSLFISLLND